MPTPRQHGGAELIHVPMMTPGFLGLNKQSASGTLGPEWATVLENAVLDDNGRVAARRGIDLITSSPLQLPFTHLAEYIRSDGTTQLCGITSNSKFYVSSDGGATWTQPAGTAVFTDSVNACLRNFNNQMWLFSNGSKPIYYNGTTVAQVTDVNAPTGHIALTAFGRVWVALQDGHTVKYSALLDGTDWTSSDSGLADMWSVWPDNDQITALAAFNGVLTVFGRRTIIMWTDGAGSALGINPLQMYVVDTIKGTGALSQHSLQHVDGDLWFLSDYGLQSLGRVIREKSNPINNLSKNVQDYLSACVSSTDLSLLRSAYSPRDKFYLLSLPKGSTSGGGLAFVFDTRGKLEDGAARSLGTWSLVPSAVTVTTAGRIIIQRDAETSGRVGVYQGTSDYAAPFVFDYESGWLDLTKSGYLLIPKRYAGVFFSDNSIDIVYKWALDFSSDYKTRTKRFIGDLGAAEWGTAEWGEAEFSGGVNLRQGAVPSSGTGQYIKIGVSSRINGTQLAVQRLGLFTKVGRFA